MSIYEQRSSVTFYATFKNAIGEQAIISSGPTISIHHFGGGSIVTDLIATPMTQLSGSTYYYDYSIPANADKAKYVAIFSGIYSEGMTVIGSEDFLVVEKGFYKRRGGGLVTKISKDFVWSKFEKQHVIDMIKEIQQKIDSLSEKHFETEFSLSKEIKENLDGLKKEVLLLDSKIIGEEKIQKIIDETKGISESIISKLGVFDSIAEKSVDGQREDAESIALICKQLDLLLKNVHSIDLTIKSDRSGIIVSDLEDLRLELLEFKKAFLATLSTEVIEAIKNEDN